MGVEGEEREKRKKEGETDTDTEPHRTTLHHITHNTTHTHTQLNTVTVHNLTLFIINHVTSLSGMVQNPQSVPAVLGPQEAVQLVTQ